uniref:TonB-dependent receptor plug domain-containing protein n=1 Tax=uncultured Caulobacter sp. TaxID=158749 RepID=UPI0025F20881|nr:TonB-dependent receptor [uncultured Caulobacter sp.]
MCAKTKGRLAASSALALMAVAAPALAQTRAADDTVTEVIVTGSRFGPRVATQSVTPVDTLSTQDLAKTGASDLQGQLKVAVPSFSTPRPSAAGAVDFLTPPTLRGLSTGQILMLVNGKRRHTNAELNSNNQIGRGDVAYDFNAIPTAAIGSVEVLRDGAAAQYGSDAIAGVINVQLDRSLGLQARARYGVTDRGDGEDTQLSLGYGVGVGDGGFVRLTGFYQDHGHTDRALADTRQQYFGTSGGGLTMPSGNYGSGVGLTPSNGTLDAREATVDRNTWLYGEPDYKNAGVFVNAELPVTAAVTAYAFGGYNRLDGTSYNYIRRAGQDETVRALYPNGFRPEQQSRLENYSGAAGLKGADLAGFAWDLSTVYGVSVDELRVTNSNNASYGAASPTSVLRGGHKFRQWTTNLDLTRELDLGGGSPVKLALGAEYRKEWYSLRAGEPASYQNGGAPILDGPNAGKPAPVGIQSAVGISPSDVIPGQRDSKAAYAEVEKDFGDRLRLSAAARYEDYSDFGDTANYKVSGRFEITDDLALRATVGSGFRAPALAQSYYSQSDFSFVNGQLLKVRIVSVNDALAPLIGAKPLKPEKSNNVSGGLVFNHGPFAATFDAYQIKLKDRIVISSNFQSTALTNFLATQGFSGIAAVAYLTNAVDTTTKGFDVTARYRQDFGDLGRVTATLAGSYAKTTFDRIDGTPPAVAAFGVTAPLVDLTQQVRLTRSAPRDKQTANLAWDKGRWRVNLTATRYGKVSQVALTGKTQAQVAALIPGYNVTVVPSAPGSANSDIIQHFRADIVTDLDVGFEVSRALTLTTGVANLFDKFPEKQIASTAASVAAGTNGADNAGIFPYAFIAPYGVSGRFFYVKAAYSF